MKAIKCLLVFSLLVSLARGQNYYVVNNQPGAQADYSSLQSALDNVAAGSIILLQPSGLDYGNVSVNKPVVIYGAGYFIGQNAPPSTQAKLITSKVKFMYFSSKASGSQISGIYFAQSKTVDAAMSFDTANNIRISRCYFENFSGIGQGSVPRFFQFINSTDISISQCFMATSGTSGDQDAIMYTAGVNDGIVLSNNIISGYGRTNAFDNAPHDNITFLNNTFLGDIGDHLNNNTFLNNIIIYAPGRTPGFTSGMNGSSAHNVSNKSIFPNAAANSVNANTTQDSIFNTFGITSTDAYFRLRANTAATGYGTDGKDCGAYGGSYPYLLSGIPAIPNFYFVEVTGDATQQGGLKVQLKIKANN